MLALWFGVETRSGRVVNLILLLFAVDLLGDLVGSVCLEI